LGNQEKPIKRRRLWVLENTVGSVQASMARLSWRIDEKRQRQPYSVLFIIEVNMSQFLDSA